MTTSLVSAIILGPRVGRGVSREVLIAKYGFHLSEKCEEEMCKRDSHMHTQIEREREEGWRGREGQKRERERERERIIAQRDRD